jgi:hypothetical protein
VLLDQTVAKPGGLCDVPDADGRDATLGAKPWLGLQDSGLRPLSISFFGFIVENFRKLGVDRQLYNCKARWHNPRSSDKPRGAQIR